MSMLLHSREMGVIFGSSLVHIVVEWPLSHLCTVFRLPPMTVRKKCILDRNACYVCTELLQILEPRGSNIVLRSEYIFNCINV